MHCIVNVIVFGFIFISNGVGPGVYLSRQWSKAFNYADGESCAALRAASSGDVIRARVPPPPSPQQQQPSCLGDMISLGSFLPASPGSCYESRRDDVVRGAANGQFSGIACQHVWWRGTAVHGRVG